MTAANLARPGRLKAVRRFTGVTLDVLLGGCVLALIARITVFLRRRGPDEYDTIDVAAGVEIAIVCLTMVLLVLAARNLQALWRRLARSAAQLWCAYYLLGVLMAVQALSPSYSCFRAVEALSQTLAVGIVLASCQHFRRAETIALVLAWGALLLDAFGRVRLSGFGTSEFASNSFSASAAIVACYSFGEALEARGGRRLMLFGSAAAAAALVVAGLSLASWWAALAGLLLAGVVLRPSPGAAIVVLLLALAALGWGADLVEHLVLRNRPLTEISTLHGRMVLWEYYWDAFCERPWLGYGFAIGARLKGIAYTTHTHNAVLSALLGMGIPGLLLMAGAAVRYVREVLRSRTWGTPGWVGCTAALACGSINSMSIAFIGEGWMPATLVFTTFLMLHALQVMRAPPVRPPAPAPGAP